MSDETPAELRLVRDFINTHEIGGQEDLATAADAGSWLNERGLIPSAVRLSAGDAATLRDVREALRAVARTHHGDPPDPEATRVLNRAAALAPLQVEFGADGRPELSPSGSGLGAALGRILGDVVAARTTGTWPRLKVCPAETCQEAFYDNSKNASRRWCSMEVCGNRAKTRSYRRRHREEAAG